jgi:hypothetical protein
MLLGVLAGLNNAPDRIFDDAECTAGVPLESGADRLPGLPERKALTRPAQSVRVFQQLVLVANVLDRRLVIKALRLDVGNQLGIDLDEVIEADDLCGDTEQLLKVPGGGPRVADVPLRADCAAAYLAGHAAFD